MCVCGDGGSNYKNHTSDKEFVSKIISVNRTLRYLKSLVSRNDLGELKQIFSFHNKKYRTQGN